MEQIKRLETILRGEVWVADLGETLGSEQQKRRPVLILQNDADNQNSPTTIITPITSQIKRPFLHSHVILSKINPLLERSMVLAEQVRAIDRQRLEYYVGRLCESDMLAVERALLHCLGAK